MIIELTITLGHYSKNNSVFWKVKKFFFSFEISFKTEQHVKNSCNCFSCNSFIWKKLEGNVHSQENFYLIETLKAIMFEIYPIFCVLGVTIVCHSEAIIFNEHPLSGLS